MIDYGRHLLPDAIETNWFTAKRAHLVVLKVMERGECSGDNLYEVEKVRMMHTQGLFLVTDIKVKVLLKNGVKRFRYIVNLTLFYASLKRFCAHKQLDCIRMKSRNSGEHVKINKD